MLFSNGHLLARTSCPVTINRIATNLRQEGVKFSAETLNKYLHYLQEAYLLSARLEVAVGGVGLGTRFYSN